MRSQGDWGLCPQQAEEVAIHLHCLPLVIGAISKLVGNKKRIEENQLDSKNGHKLGFDIGFIFHLCIICFSEKALRLDVSD